MIWACIIGAWGENGLCGNCLRSSYLPVAAGSRKRCVRGGCSRHDAVLSVSALTYLMPRRPATANVDHGFSSGNDGQSGRELTKCRRRAGCPLTGPRIHLEKAQNRRRFKRIAPCGHWTADRRSIVCVAPLAISKPCSLHCEVDLPDRLSGYQLAVRNVSRARIQ